MRILTIVLILLVSGVAYAAENLEDNMEIIVKPHESLYHTNDPSIIADLNLYPSDVYTELHIYSPDGRRAVIDFGGDAVTYSGDLPVAESARLFFEHFKSLCGEEKR